MSGCKDCKCEDKKGCSCFGNGVVIPTGPNGENGLSAYQEAVLNGFVGNFAAWEASLVGPQGPVGPAGTITPLVWTDLVLINGWTVSGIPNQVPQYCIDPYGYIRFRGVLDGSSASSNVFADLSSIITLNTKSRFGTLVNTNKDLEFIDIIAPTNVIQTDRTTGFTPILNTITPQYILD